MTSQNGLPSQLGNLVIQDYVQNRNESAYCRYLEIFDEAYGGRNPGFSGPRNLFCQPPSEPPPTTETLPGGGEPCRLYNVTVETTSNTGSSSTTVYNNIRGPIRLQRYRTTAPPNRYLGNDNLLGGDGVNCPVSRLQVSGFDGTTPEAVTSNIIAVVPVDGQPDTVPPLPAPPDPRDLPRGPELNFPVTINLGGQELNFDLQFDIPVFAPIGVFAPVFAPVSPQFDFNFNPQLNPSPRIGIDLNLEFAVNLPPAGGGDNPPSDQPPVPLPPVNPPQAGGDCPDLDYDRIERIVQEYQCCKPATNFSSLGTFTFDTPNRVFNIQLPSNAVLVFIAIIPGDNTRAYKFAGLDAEYGHGNASITTQGDVLGFERIYVNNHALTVPFELPDKGLRLSLKEGTIASVSVGSFVPTEEQ